MHHARGCFFGTLSFTCRDVLPVKSAVELSLARR